MSTFLRSHLRNAFPRSYLVRTFASKLKPSGYIDNPSQHTAKRSTQIPEEIGDTPPPPPPPPPPRPSHWRSTWRFAFFFNTGILLFIHHFLYNHYSLSASSGASMLPTMYLSGEWNIISKHHRRGRDLRVGDVICAHSPIEEGVSIIKRVIGLPGDFVYVEGRGMVRIPVGCCWVGGDNVAFSRDSRHYGPLPLGLVIGRVVYRLFPLRRRGKVENILKEVDERDLAPN